MQNKCFECETTENVERHHVVPKSLGGTKMIPLCEKCHALAHGNSKLRKDNHSQLTKAALAAKKARGEKLGNPDNFTDETRAKGRAAHKEKSMSNQNTKTARGYASLLRTGGASLRTIADTLNKEGFKTARSGQYSAVQVARLFKEYQND